MPQAAIVGLGATAHLLYGGVAGALLTVIADRVTLWRGIAWGSALWALMGLPYLGWGPFGVAAAPPIAVATFVIHLAYGATLGWLVDRGSATSAGSSARRQRRAGTSEERAWALFVTRLSACDPNGVQPSVGWGDEARLAAVPRR